VKKSITQFGKEYVKLEMNELSGAH
jgi:hypothetical protein